MVIGIASGWVLWSSWWLRTVLAPHVINFQAAPKIAIAPLLVWWFGLGLTSQLDFIVMLAFFPMMVATLLGLSAVDSDLEALGRVLGLSRRAYFLRIQLPSASPALFAGAKVAVIDAMTGAFLADYEKKRQGLGYLMVLGYLHQSTRRC